ncbi:MAG: hypothetical protein ACRCR5_01080, partial [Lactococcus garvieae]
MADYVLGTVINLRDNFSTVLNRISTQTQRFQNRFRSAMQRVTGAIARMSQKGGAEFNKLKEVSGKAFNSMKTQALVAVGAMTGALAKLGSAGVKSASNFEGLFAKMKTATKGDLGQAQDLYKWSNEFANSTAFGNDEVIDSTVKLKMQGFNPKNVMTPISDMASSMGKTLDQATEAYLDAKTGELERFKEFGITKNDIIAHNKDMKKMGIDVGVAFDKNGSLKDAEALMLTITSLMSKKFKGGTANLADTLIGQFSTAKGNMNASMGKLFGAMEDGSVRSGSMIDMLKGKLKKFNDYMLTAGGKAKVTEMMEKIDKLVPVVGKAIDSLAKGFMKVMDSDFMSGKGKVNLETMFSGFGWAIDNVGLLLKSFLRFKGAVLGLNLGGAIGGIIGAFTPLGAGVGSMIGKGIGAGIGAFLPEIISYAKELYKAFKPALEGILEVLKPIGNMFKLVFQDVALPLFMALKSAFVSYVKKMGDVWSSVFGLIVSVMKPVSTIFEKILMPVVRGLITVIGGIFTVLSPLFELIYNVLVVPFKLVATVIGSLLMPVLDGLFTAIGGVVGVLATVFQAIWDFMVKPMLNGVGMMIQAVNSVIELIIGGVVGAFGKLGSAIEKLLNKIPFLKKDKDKPEGKPEDKPEDEPEDNSDNKEIEKFKQETRDLEEVKYGKSEKVNPFNAEGIQDYEKDFLRNKANEKGFAKIADKTTNNIVGDTNTTNKDVVNSATTDNSISNSPTN